MAKCLMVQGTSSYAGKSFLVGALCRIFADKGYKVSPFKAQNTSLNSFVTKDCKEIARAQALQALAAGIEPQVEMNPILIKPKREHRAQVILNGVPLKDIDARKYYKEFALSEGIDTIKAAFKKLEKEYDLIIIEGAGSPAEINLYAQDIANMRIAELADASVILVADIDRGGVFANIYGTIKLLKPKHRRRVKGIVINKFRGDIEILKPGIKMIEKLVQKPVVGVIPYIPDLRLPGEDSISMEEYRKAEGTIAVIKLPRISNFTDFDPLIYDGIKVQFVAEPGEIDQNTNAVIIPGTKNTVEDLKWLKSMGFDKVIKKLKSKILIIGICGGYQMLGKRITDRGVEGRGERIIGGLGLLDAETKFDSYKKITKQVKGKIIANSGIFKNLKGIEVQGYEIHMGKTILGKNAKPLIDLGGKYDGAVDKEGMVFGTYLHGIFDSGNFRKKFLRYFGRETKINDIRKTWEKSIRNAAEVVSKNVNIPEIERWLDE